MKKLLAICLLAGALLCLLPTHAHAATCYAPCVICNGSAKCGLCDPALIPDALGDGWLECPWCHGTGEIVCGTNHAGDGTPIGCDGSGRLPDGSVCPVCGGEGKYDCDGCHGALKVECKCREAGQPGKCHVCFGTGWRIVDSMGIGVNTEPVYPPDGATIDAGVWGRHEYFTYDASRFGYGVTPYQAMAAAGATTIDDFYRVLRGGTPVGGQMPAPSASPGPATPAPQPSNEPQPSGDPTPEPGPTPPDGPPDPQDEDNPYEVSVPDDEALVAQVAEGSSDMLYLLSTHVSGGFLLTVQVQRSSLSEKELLSLQSMTAQDFAALKAELLSAANGMSEWLPPPAPVHMREENVCVRWRIGEGLTLPFRCDMLLQIPEATQGRDMKLYRLQDGVLYEDGGFRACDLYRDREYLILNVDRLGEFVYTDAAVTLGAEQSPTTAPEPEPARETAPSHEPEPRAEQESPRPEAQEEGGASPLPYVLIALGGVLVGAAAVFVITKKRK